ncbi:MAG: thioesterase domain-containing protein, partial [Segetibacter sp.]
ILLQNPEINQAVVVARKDQQGNNKLTAYVVSYNASLDRQKIFLYLRERLPEFMIPAEVILLSRFPLTQNGKFDRVSLSEVEEIKEFKEGDFKEPANETEKMLAKICSEILGLERISTNDNFFEIGGSSLQAAKMFSKIRKVFGLKLSLGLLHHAKTIEQIAAIVISRADEKHFSCLVPIQAGGSKPPLFCVHGGWGHVLFYQGLADQLGSDQPLYGLQVRGLNGIDKPFYKLEDMAAHYVQEIRQVQPTGPYQLAGYCYGAIVAFEMANQFIQNNEEVALLVNFNGPSPGYLPDKGEENSSAENKNFIKTKGTVSGKVNAVAHDLSVEIKRFSKLNTKQKALYPLKQINKMFWSSKIRISLSNALFSALCKYCIRSKKAMPDTILKRYIVESMYRAFIQYNAKAYGGKMIIFRSPCLYKDPSLGWTNLVEGGITTFDVPGEYGVGNAIFRKPYVESVANQLEKYLRK